MIPAPPPAFRVLALYSTTVESGHIRFADAAVPFYTNLAQENGFIFEATTDWNRLNDAELSAYDVVVWLNHFPQTAPQRQAFERYMEAGGAWLGFHVSAYNDRHTAWPWLVQFLGGAVFHTNNWPPLPAHIEVDDNDHPVTRRLPATGYTAPTDEWYAWLPSPRLNPDVRVLLTLHPSNYPLGQKNLLTEGDIPVAWTNTRYAMLYLNMGHTEQSFDSDVQNRLFTDALLGLGLAQADKRANQSATK